MMGRLRLLASALALSASGLVGIALWEGYSDKAYDDGVGVATIGFGTTTRADGTPVEMGDTITPPKALDRMIADISRYEGAVKQCVTVPLYQHEYDAFVSFSYNVGTHAFCTSRLVRKLNAGDYAGACEELLLWVYAGGKRLQGLVNRREAERKQCLGLNQQPKGAT
jgi:lysozyme